MTAWDALRRYVFLEYALRVKRVRLLVSNPKYPLPYRLLDMGLVPKEVRQ